MEAVAHSDADDDGQDDRNDSLTPRRAGKSNTRTNLKVVVTSPSHTRPKKRRQHLGMEGESADPSSENVEQTELVKGISNEQWVGTGEVC